MYKSKPDNVEINPAKCQKVLYFRINGVLLFRQCQCKAMLSGFCSRHTYKRIKR